MGRNNSKFSNPDDGNKNEKNRGEELKSDNKTKQKRISKAAKESPDGKRLSDIEPSQNPHENRGEYDELLEDEDAISVQGRNGHISEEVSGNCLQSVSQTITEENTSNKESTRASHSLNGGTDDARVHSQEESFDQGADYDEIGNSVIQISGSSGFDTCKNENEQRTETKREKVEHGCSYEITPTSPAEIGGTAEFVKLPFVDRDSDTSKNEHEQTGAAKSEKIPNYYSNKIHLTNTHPFETNGSTDSLKFSFEDRDSCSQNKNTKKRNFEVKVEHLPALLFTKKSSENDDGVLNYLKITAYYTPPEGQLFVQVFAIGHGGKPVFWSALTNIGLVRVILSQPDRRTECIRDKYFRLATFSFCPSQLEMGCMLRLAEEGYFYDIDDEIKCAFCSNKYTRNNLANGHFSNCPLQTGIGSDGGNFTNDLLVYGTSSHDLYVPSGESLPEPNNIGSDTAVCLRRLKLYFRQKETVQRHIPQDAEHERSNEASCSEFPTTQNGSSCHNNPSPVPPQQSQGLHEDRIISLRSQAVYRGQTRQCGGSKNSLHEYLDANSPTNTTRRYFITKKNKVREKRCTLMTENGRLISRTLCCVCRERRRNVVFMPCGHLVVCNICIKDITSCPICCKPIDTAYAVNNDI